MQYEYLMQYMSVKVGRLQIEQITPIELRILKLDTKRISGIPKVLQSTRYVCIIL